MSNLSKVEERLPPGFRFHPRDEELVCDYLMKKMACSDCPLLIEVDLNKCEPWDIPETACVGGKEWYFYSQRDRKYATGLRTNRATVSGYWKATGKDRPVLSRGTLVGMRKTLVFYQGRAPKGRKTSWVMHEFRLEGALGPHYQNCREDWVLCRVFCKNREVPSKQRMGSGYDDTSSPSLPPLMDNMDSYLSFDQTQMNVNEFDEQVPCFSNFTPYQLNQISFPLTTHMEPSISATLEGVPQLIGTSLSPFSCENKVISAVLDHFSKIESVNPNMEGSQSLCEGSSESFLSDVGLHTMWNPY
ncbi:hypothetical protein NMG60_11001989 [Bertholletia excelsa]